MTKDRPRANVDRDGVQLEKEHEFENAASLMQGTKLVSTAKILQQDWASVHSIFFRRNAALGRMSASHSKKGNISICSDLVLLCPSDTCPIPP